MVAVTCASGANVIIDTNTQYQTIRGYGCVTWQPAHTTPELREETELEMVNEFGVTRVRMEGIGGNSAENRRWEWFNDDADPDHFNWSGFNTNAFDDLIQNRFLPIKRKIEANGGPFDLYVSPSFFNSGKVGEAPVWLLRNAGEYAEFAMSMLLRLRDVHGIEANYYSILNEAGNANSFSPAIVQQMIKTLGPKMEAAGLKTKIEFPESISVDEAWRYISGTTNDPEMWSHVGLVSYHLYGGTNQYQALRDYAWSKGLPTAQSEYMSLTTSTLYNDLTLGGVSFWEIYGMTSQLDTSLANYNKLVRSGYYWPFRQLLHYVRPGAVRVNAATDDSLMRVLAFVRNGKTIVVIFNDLNSTARTINLSGLTAGTYGVCQSVNKAAYVERGLQTVGSGGTLTVSVPGSTVLTLYPYAGTNQPPTVTDWKASQGYLEPPASSVTLSAAAQDPELDPVSFRWTVKSSPPGAVVVLSSTNSATCTATGLTQPGKYAFNLEASDPTHVLQREARVTVFASNQPPWIDISELHNRNPVVVTLPLNYTHLRSWTVDLEGNPLSYNWTVSSQPEGANVFLATPTNANTLATNMDFPGDYVFQYDVSDGISTSSAFLTVPVYPPDTAPVISSASASPASLTGPASATMLNASVRDPDSDPVSVWWSIKSAPVGALPIFSTPGKTNTQVQGLIIPGSYVFTLTAADRAAYAVRDVTVTVTAGTASPRLSLAVPNGSETYRGGQQIQIRWASWSLAGPVKLEFFNGSSWVTIAAETDNDGIEPWTVPNWKLENCRVRVSSATNDVASDASDGLFTISTIGDARADADADGMPDGWEAAFLGGDGVANASTDTDGDGFLDLAEYLADTDPLSANSNLKITGIQPVPQGIRVDWKGGVEASQILQVRRTLGSDTAPWENLLTNPAPTSPAGSVITPLGTNQFYRIKATR